MPNTNKLPDEITWQQIQELNLQSVCHQQTMRKVLRRKYYNSTAFFISKNILLTSAHNVVKTLSRVREIELTPSRMGAESPYGKVSWEINAEKHIRIYPEYNIRDKRERKLFDIAMVYVPDEVLKQSPKFQELQPLKLLELPRTISYGNKVYCPGYPAYGQHAGRHQMTLDTSTVGAIRRHTFEHQLQTVPGNSGSPIMVERNGELWVVAVNSIANEATLINHEKLLWIERCMNELG